MNYTDAQLVETYILGNDESLKELLERYTNPIYNFVYRLSQDAETASDITQETFIKVWKNLKKYNPNQSFKVWIYSIARNTTIDWLRKRKNIHFSEMDSGDYSMESNIPDTGILPDEFAILEENKHLINKMVSELSPPNQTILTLRYTEELSFKEIGQVLDKPENTVKSQHRRAIIELKQHLNATK